ncbi:uncharacterized protein ankrd50l [Stigmatopora argus]
MSGPAVPRDRRFLCREWALDELWRGLEARRAAGSPPGVLVTGGPGAGKTALCVQATRPDSQAGRASGLAARCLARHFCRRGEPGAALPWRFVMALVEQLRTAAALPPRHAADLRRRLPPGAPDCRGDPDLAFRRFVLKPLLDLPPPPQTVMILVDSLDTDPRETSAGTGKSRSIAELLAAHQKQIPDWIFLVCSLRCQSKAVSKMFPGFCKLRLDDLRRPNPVHDVQRYILKRLDREAALRRQVTPDTADMLNLLYIKSGGCFLYLERVLDGVAASLVGLREIRDIPGTLNGLYLWLCQRLFPRGLFHDVKPLLNVILAAPGALAPRRLFAAVWARDRGLGVEEFEKKLGALGPILTDGPEGGKALFHHSFAEWLTDIKYCSGKYVCDPAEGHGALAASLTWRGPRLRSEEAVQLGTHLVCSGRHRDKPWLLALWMIWADVPALTLSAGALLSTLETRAPTSAHREVLRLLTMSGLVAAEPGDSNGELAHGELRRDRASANGQLSLADAVPEGNADRVLLLLSAGSDPFLGDKRGQTPLGLASRLGRPDVLRVLLDWVRKRGAGTASEMLERADQEGWTPLRSAAWGGHAQAVRLLLEAGAKVDGCDGKGRTALRAAAWGGHRETVLVLLDYEAQADKADWKGRTPLIAAAYMGHPEAAAALLNRGARVDLADGDGRTALSVVALCGPSVPGRRGYGEVARLLLEHGANPGHRDRDRMTPLLLAAHEGHDDIVELLLDAGADVDETAGGRGARVTPLLAAAAMGHVQTVTRLLFWGALADAVDDEGRTALGLAAARGSAGAVRVLLERGLDENHKDDLGWTPLHAAAHEGHRAVCAALTEPGSAARVGETDAEGRTALMLAAREGHLGAARLLLDRRSPVDHRSHDGRSALSAALLEDRGEVAQLLLRRGADVDVRDAEGRPLLYLLVLDGRLGAAALLLEKGGPPPESRDSEGRTALHVACWRGDAEAADLLLKHGADPNARDAEGRPPLHSAAWTGHAQAARRLLSASGVAIDLACRQGATALGIAAQQGHADVVSVLLEEGKADPHHVDKYGRTPAMVARRHERHKVLRLLEKFGGEPRGGPATRGGALSPDKNILASKTPISPSVASPAHSSRKWSTGHSLATLPTVPADTLSFTEEVQRRSLPRSRGRPSKRPPAQGESLCGVRSDTPPKVSSRNLGFEDRGNLKNPERIAPAGAGKASQSSIPARVRGPQQGQAWDPPPKRNATMVPGVSVQTPGQRLHMKRAVKLRFGGPVGTSFNKRETPL